MLLVCGMLAAGCPQRAENIWGSELGKQPGIPHSRTLLLLPEVGIHGRIPSFLEKTEGLGSEMGIYGRIPSFLEKTEGLGSEMGIHGRIPSFLEKTEGLGSTKATPRNTWVALPRAVIQKYPKFPKMPSQVAA